MQTAEARTTTSRTEKYLFDNWRANRKVIYAPTSRKLWYVGRIGIGDVAPEDFVVGVSEFKLHSDLPIEVTILWPVRK